MKVYFQERIWLYFSIWRQPDSEEAEGFRAEPGEVEQKGYCATAQTVSELVRELSSASESWIYTGFLHTQG